MAEVVVNNVGPVGKNYSEIYPFNSSEYYNKYCVIDLEDMWHFNLTAI